MFIEIEDDGAGINKERVLSKALEKGVVTSELASKLTDNQINELILASGFSTAEVLSDIVDAVGDSMKVFVDGGIRSGVDVFKALALGADGVLICRTFVTALYGGEEEGLKTYINKLASELEDTMAMCGAHSLKEISKDMIYRV